MPPFNGCRTVFETEHQGIVFLRSDSRYFIVKGIRAFHDILGDGNEYIFRNLLGWAVCFPHRIESAADPHRSSLGDLSAVVLSAATAYHYSGEGICLLLDTGMGMLIGAASYLFLHSVKLSQRDDWLVAVRYVVLW